MRVIILALNRIADRAESLEIVAVSDDYLKLLYWYTDQLAYVPYQDHIANDYYNKYFTRGSALEWFNPAPSRMAPEFTGTLEEGFNAVDVDLQDLNYIRSNYVWV